METQIKNIATRFFEGNAAPDEIVTLFRWVVVSNERLREFNSYEKSWKDNHIPSDEVLLSLGNLKSRIRTYSVRRTWKRIAYVTATAAAVILLFFAFGKTVGLKGSMFKTTPQEYVVEVPMGMNTKVSLPDGTTVKLNAGSKLAYSSDFNKKSRDVSLVGEAYFEVAHNKDLPFNVSACGCTVSVLGTKFDVSAYENDNFVYAALIEGSVAFKVNDKEERMCPGELVTFSHNNLKKEIVDVRQYKGWAEGLIKYDNISFSSLLNRLEREYDVQIDLQDKSLSDRYIRVSFSHEDSIDTIIKVLSDILPIESTKEGRTYNISQR